MLQLKAKILYNKEVKENYFHLAVQAPKITKEALPGQFLNIKVNDAFQPLLRRPLSIHRVKGANIELLYEVVGKATRILSQRKPGGYLDIIGPLGNGFDYRLPITPASPAGGDYRLPILVAGGMGVAPLLFLAEKLVKSGVRSQESGVTNRILVLVGAKTKNQITCEKEFKKTGCTVQIATDDGSKGFRGKVTELLERLPPTINSQLLTFYACGPRLMLKEISRLAKEKNIPAQVSLEEHMACGIGACLGCVVNTKEGFKRVCKEGPVFHGDEIIW